MNILPRRVSTCYLYCFTFMSSSSPLTQIISVSLEDALSLRPQSLPLLLSSCFTRSLPPFLSSSFLSLSLSLLHTHILSWIYSLPPHTSLLSLSGLRLAQLTNKCTSGEEDLEYFIAESGKTRSRIHWIECVTQQTDRHHIHHIAIVQCSTTYMITTIWYNLTLYDSI